MSVENIHIAILGSVSAGKTTFFNSLCSDRMSDMMRKKTTMNGAPTGMSGYFHENVALIIHSINE